MSNTDVEFDAMEDVEFCKKQITGFKNGINAIEFHKHFAIEKIKYLRRQYGEDYQSVAIIRLQERIKEYESDINLYKGKIEKYEAEIESVRTKFALTNDQNI